MPLKEAVVLGLPPKVPHNHLMERFERFFASAKRSESGGVPVPKVFEGLLGDTSRHVRGKEKKPPSVNESALFMWRREKRTTFLVTDFSFCPMKSRRPKKAPHLADPPPLADTRSTFYV